MPVYEFICNDCDTSFEVTASFFEELDAPECPACRSKDTHKKDSFSMPSSEIDGASCGEGGGRFT